MEHITIYLLVGINEMQHRLADIYSPKKKSSNWHVQGGGEGVFVQVQQCFLQAVAKRPESSLYKKPMVSKTVSSIEEEELFLQD
jgi:hypothetical protein